MFSRTPPLTWETLEGTVDVTDICYCLLISGAAGDYCAKRASMCISLQTKLGTRMEFIRCLESTGVRLVNRAWQRGIGESLIVGAEGETQCLNFHKYVETFCASERFREWHTPLLRFILRSHYTKEHQKLLQYIVVLQAFTDTLDEKHQSTGQSSVPAQTAKKTRKSLRYPVFKVYLPSVKTPQVHLNVTVDLVKLKMVKRSKKRRARRAFSCHLLRR